jgi:hypothetical protein
MAMMPVDAGRGPKEAMKELMEVVNVSLVVKVPIEAVRVPCQWKRWECQ